MRSLIEILVFWGFTKCRVPKDIQLFYTDLYLNIEHFYFEGSDKTTVTSCFIIYFLEIAVSALVLEMCKI